MFNKLSGRYCFEEDGYNQIYCIPIELQNKFRKLFDEIVMLKVEGSNKQLEKIDLFNSIFESCRLDKPISEYSFTNLQEMEN